MSKKVKITIIIIVCVLALVVGGILVLINTNAYKETLIRRDLRSITEEFYSYYYDENTKNKSAKEYLSQFGKTGLSTTLGNMQVFLNDRTKKDYGYKSLEKCDVANTKVIIKPKDPYTKKDIDIEFVLSCKYE